MSKILGIDLGTSTSEIAYIKDEEVVLIPNHLGKFITPSVVNIAQDGKITVGEEAKQKLLLEPNNTFMEVKRLIGGDQVLKAHGKEYTPQMILSYIIKYLVECAEKELNEKVTRTVITVPAYFSDNQRRSIKEAGELAGVSVERIINEPTAASLDYGMDHLEECKNILVYDLGGGTLDVTVLEIFNGVIEVKASCGNNKLGGKDFDEAVINYIASDFRKKHRYDIFKDLRGLMQLKTEVEQCKINLSEKDEYEISLPFFANIKGKPVALEYKITRSLFESLIKGKIDSTLTQIDTAINDANLTVKDIDIVLMVGGSTRIPYVKEMLENKFQKEPKHLLDPDLAVVRGASIQAGIINSEISAENSLVFTDVCPYTLGTAVLNSFNTLEMSVIIPRNTTIPTTKKHTYSTCHPKQTEVEITAYQGESQNPENNNFLGSFEIKDIPTDGKNTQAVDISFSYDLNGILNVEVEFVSTGRKEQLEISILDQNTIEEVDVTNWKDCPQAKRYMAIIKKAEKMLVNELVPTYDLSDAILKLKQAIVLNKDRDEIEDVKDELIGEIEAIEESTKILKEKLQEVIKDLDKGINVR